MFLWLRYCFDLNNFKKYKQEIKDKNTNKNETDSKLIDLTSKLELLNTNVKEKLNDIEKNLKDKIEEKIKSTNDLNAEKFSNLKENFELNIKNVKNDINNNFKNSNDLNAEQLKNLKNEHFEKIEKIKELNANNFDSNKTFFETELKSLKEINTNQINLLSETTKKTENVVSEIKSLFENNKLRGNIGEILLEEIFSNGFGSNNIDNKNSIWQKQYTFKNKKTVDFIVRHPSLKKMIPIDSKFPLDKIQEFWKKSNSELLSSKDSNDKLLKGIKRDVSSMIKDIKSKYIDGTDETVNFALMFIPSDSIYNFLLENTKDLYEQANKNGVYICSPTNILAIVSILLASTKDVQIYENLNKIIKLIVEIQEEYKRLNTRWYNQVKSFDKVNEEIKKLTITFEKINKKAENITSLNTKENNVSILEEKNFNVIKENNLVN